MSANDEAYAFTFLTGIAVASLFWLAIIIFPCQHSWEKACIKHNAAYYHPETGVFTWRTCEKAE